MEIGQVFEFNSNGTIRKAIFKEEVDGKIVCILIGDTRTQGVEIKINKKLIKEKK
jgi:hypothetical protein